VALKLWLGACFAALATLAATSTSALADISCSGQTYVKPFVPWLDPGDYTLVANGALESVDGWALSGNATLAPGNEPWRVGNADDARSLLLASGSSATSPPLCVTLLHPTLRFFAMNAGSSLVSLKVDAITEVGGVRLTTPIAVLAAGRNWQPTLPIASRRSRARLSSASRRSGSGRAAGGSTTSTSTRSWASEQRRSDTHESPDDRRVELRPGISYELGDRLLDWQRTAVAAVGRHRIERVAAREG
jgi:hypothetical protein